MAQTAPNHPTAPTDWAVVSTVREPAVLVLAFACHHLTLGAQRIHLFFDNPEDPAAEVLARVPGVEVTLCDAAHWAQFGAPRANYQTRRQTLNANLVVAQEAAAGRATWLLHADADEFLWAPDGIAAEIPKDQDRLHLPNIERCWTSADAQLFGTTFRARVKGRATSRRIHGDTAQYLSGGLSGHSSGKAMMRCGSTGFLGIHMVRDKRGGRDLTHATASRARILHFDGLTPRHWALKTLRYASRPGTLHHMLHPARRRAVDRILAADEPLTEALALDEAMFRLSLVRAAQLTGLGALGEFPLDLAGAIRAHAPGATVDLSAAAFDALHEDELQALNTQLKRKRPS